MKFLFFIFLILINNIKMSGLILIGSFYLLFVIFLVIYKIIDPDGLNEFFKNNGLFSDDN